MIARHPVQPALQNLELAADMQQQTANESVGRHVDECAEHYANKLICMSQTIHCHGGIVVVRQPNSGYQFSLPENRQQGHHKIAHARKLRQDYPAECSSAER